MKKWIKRIIILIVILGVIGFIASRMMRPKEQVVEDTRPSVVTQTPVVGDIINTVEVIGTISPAQEVNVMPKLAGDVLTVNFEVGQRVTEGDSLITIDTKSTMDSLKIALDSAEITLNDANTALSRTQALFATGAVSQQQLEQAQSGARGAQLAYNNALNNFNTQSEYSNVAAPISGVIESKNVEVHDTVAQSVVICSISGDDGMSVDFGVTEDAMHNLSIGDEISIDKSGNTYEGKITEVGTKVNASGLFPIKASLGKDADDISSGTKVKLTVVSDKSTEVLTIPMEAITYSSGSPFVYTYADGKAHKTDVEVGLYDEDNIEVVSGLDASSEVITTWSKELYDGAEVLLNDNTQGTPMAMATDSDAADKTQVQ